MAKARVQRKGKKRLTAEDAAGGLLRAQQPQPIQGLTMIDGRNVRFRIVDEAGVPIRFRPHVAIQAGWFFAGFMTALSEVKR